MTKSEELRQAEAVEGALAGQQQCVGCQEWLAPLLTSFIGWPLPNGSRICEPCRASWNGVYADCGFRFPSLRDIASDEARNRINAAFLAWRDERSGSR